MGHPRLASPAFGRAAGPDCPRSGGPAAQRIVGGEHILTASKINLANIALSIKVQIHEELEAPQLTEIERKVGLGKGK